MSASLSRVASMDKARRGNGLGPRLEVSYASVKRVSSRWKRMIGSVSRVTSTDEAVRSNEAASGRVETVCSVKKIFSSCLGCL